MAARMSDPQISEAQWLETVYRPGVRQFTLRAVVVGMLIGALENNTLTTVASGAGYMTGGGNMAALGVFAAIPSKRQLINKEGLIFLTGTATAETIRTLHSVAGGPASRSDSRLRSHPAS